MSRFINSFVLPLLALLFNSVLAWLINQLPSKQDLSLKDPVVFWLTGVSIAVVFIIGLLSNNFQSNSASVNPKHKWLLWLFPIAWLAITFHFILNRQLTEAFLSFCLTFMLTVLLLTKKFFQKFINRLSQWAGVKQEQWADNLADKIEAWDEISQFQTQYYESLIYTCRDFKTEGFRIGLPVPDLEKVFVQLRVATEIPGKIPGAMIQSKDSQKSQVIWDFLAKIPEIAAYQRMAIIAPPGAGKTTLLQHLTLTYAKNAQKTQHPQAPELIPVLLYLRNIRDVITSPKPPNLPTLITDSAKNLPSRQTLNPPANWFEENLRNGKCLVMLDGLDEVADTTQRQQVSQWVNQQMEAYPNTAFILTSRPHGYHSAPVDQVKTVLEVQKFILENMKQFIHNWYLQTEIMSRAGRDDPGVRAEAKANAHDLVERIFNNPPIVKMASNPLLLTMISTVHYSGSALPERRIQLYAEICNVLLGKRQKAKKIDDLLTAEQKKSVLQELALELMKRKIRDFIPSEGKLLIQNKLTTVTNQIESEEFLKQIETVSGLLVEKEQGVYEFAHLSFQEYLAAAQIKELSQENLLIDNFHDSWWAETIRLYAAQSNSTNLILEALKNQTVDSLTLAYDFLQEGLSVTQDVRQELERILEEGLNSTDPEIANLAAQVRLARRLKNAVTN